MRTERDYIMVPERFKDYFFNDWDYLPETYPMADKEREELIRKLYDKKGYETL